MVCYESASKSQRNFAFFHPLSGKVFAFFATERQAVRAYRVTSKCLECGAVESARRPCGMPGGAKGLRWDGLYCRRLSLSEGGSQPDNLNQVRTIPFWVRYRSPLDGFQSHCRSVLVQKWSSDHKIAGNKKPQGNIVPWGFSVFWCP